MNTITAFEKAATGELTPEAAAQQMMESDQRARDQRRPSWLPRWAVAVGSTLAVALCAFVGIRSDR